MYILLYVMTLGIGLFVEARPKHLHRSEAEALWERYIGSSTPRILTYGRDADT